MGPINATQRKAPGEDFFSMVHNDDFGSEFKPSEFLDLLDTVKRKPNAIYRRSHQRRRTGKLTSASVANCGRIDPALNPSSTDHCAIRKTIIVCRQE